MNDHSWSTHFDYPGYWPGLFTKKADTPNMTNIVCVNTSISVMEENISRVWERGSGSCSSEAHGSRWGVFGKDGWEPAP